MKWILLAVMLMYGNGNAYAIEMTDLSVCRAMATNELRLECYDNITRELTGKSPAKLTNQQLLERPITRQQKLKIEKTDFGAWVVKESWLSRDTGDLAHEAYVNANDEIKIDHHKTVRPSLNIQCFKRKMFIFIRWGAYLGTGTANVTHRFDNNMQIRRDWNIEQKGLVSTVTSKHKRAFLGMLWKSKSLIVGVRPLGIEPIFSEFNLFGVKAIIHKMRNDCN